MILTIDPAEATVVAALVALLGVVSGALLRGLLQPALGPVRNSSGDVVPLSLVTGDIADLDMRVGTVEKVGQEIVGGARALLAQEAENGKALRSIARGQHRQARETAALRESIDTLAAEMRHHRETGNGLRQEAPAR